MVFGKADPAVFDMYAKRLGTPEDQPMAAKLQELFKSTSSSISTVRRRGLLYLLLSRLRWWGHWHREVQVPGTQAYSGFLLLAVCRIRFWAGGSLAPGSPRRRLIRAFRPSSSCAHPT